MMIVHGLRGPLGIPGRNAIQDGFMGTMIPLNERHRIIFIVTDMVADLHQQTVDFGHPASQM